jgi:hypothetical protein
MTGKLGNRWRLLCSVLIIGHLWAVVGRPLDFATQGPNGSSPATGAFYAPVKGYAEFAYLNHGYAFFAPDPGPNHLLRVTIDSAASSQGEANRGLPQTVTYPDRQQQWPRLLYHRHFMLTEFLHNLHQPPRIPEEVLRQPELAADWRLRRTRYETIRDSMVKHLSAVWESENIQIERIEHRLVGLPEFFEEGIKLDDPRLYTVLPDDPEAELGLPRFGQPPR